MVMTLHDYKMVCASYLMLRNGEPCEACYGGKYFKTINNRCVKNSLPKSMLSALEMYLHHRVLNLYDKVDVFIAPSLFLKNKITEMGFRKEIIHLPNFINTEQMKGINGGHDDARRGNSVVYFGRLSPEKGLCTLLDAAKKIKKTKAAKTAKRKAKAPKHKKKKKKRKK